MQNNRITSGSGFKRDKLTQVATVAAVTEIIRTRNNQDTLMIEKNNYLSSPPQLILVVADVGSTWDRRACPT